MSARPKRSLAEQLGGALPEGIEALQEHEKQDLADALREARRRQTAEIAVAGEEALKFVPGVLRGAIRKAVGL
jgi:hypothetical protein